MLIVQVLWFVWEWIRGLLKKITGIKMRTCKKFNHAHFSKNYKYIIDSDGNKVSLDDSRVMHVWPIDTYKYSTKMIANVFAQKHLNFRSSDLTNIETLQYAKKLCSGRECLPCTALTGATLKDIETNRKENEISIYYNLDQDGPCQNGAWAIVWQTFAKRLNLKNVVFMATPTVKSNYAGQGDPFGARLGIAAIVGDLLLEAENTLKCLAKDGEKAQIIFCSETKKVIESIKNGVGKLTSALKIWAEKLSKISLKAEVDKTAKVLLFGGLNVLYVHYPLTQYFISQGVIPKVVDFTEGLCWLESEQIVRYGFQKGLVCPEKQFAILPIIFSLFGLKNSCKKEGLNALRLRTHIASIEFFMKKFRKIMERSGLLFDRHIPFLDIVKNGSQYVSNNGFCETPVTTGRYLCSVKSGVFDGLINLVSFNCQPALNAQAILMPLANRVDVPFASIDCEGPWINANHRRIIETVAVQAKRVREKKNKN